MGEGTQATARSIRALLVTGAFLEAYDRVREARRSDAGALDLVALEARALDALGMRGRAIALLAAQPEPALHDVEILGLLAGMEKRDALERPQGPERAAALAAVLGRYRDGWERLGGSWFGINVATLSFLLGHPEAGKTADEVLDVVEYEEAEGTWLSEGGPEESAAWASATRGEARLILDDPDAALAAYDDLRCRAHAHRWWTTLQSARANARLVYEAAPPDAAIHGRREEIHRLLETPPVVTATGHIVDVPGRTPPRFPETRVPAVRRAVAAALEESGVSVGISSLAAGADLIFQGELQRLGATRHAILPFDARVFCEQSVHGRGHYPWAQAFQRLWQTAERRVQVAGHPHEWEAFAYRFANEVQHGLALLEADRLETGLAGIAVWDGCEGDGPAGTQAVVQLWRERGGLTRETIIHPQAPEGAEAAGAPPTDAGTSRFESREEAADSFRPGSSAVAGIVFADAKGFSGLDETMTLRFAEYFLEEVAHVQQGHASDIFESNTWGDGLFYVFRDLRGCAAFALELAEAMEEMKPRLESEGFPGTMGLRLAIHAAPVRILEDPVTRRIRASGSEISFAARIEPITPVNQVYASQSYAALARARGLEGFRFRYVGVHALAKRFGEAPLYRLERLSPVA